MYLAIDIGGTKTLAAVFDDEGKKVEENKFPTPKDYDVFVDELANLVASFTTKSFSGAAIAVPGRIDRESGVGIAFGNLPWRDVPIKKDLGDRLGCPVVIENDAKLAALSEALLLAGEYREVLYVTISTGIGAGFVVDGEINPALADMEAGHMPIEHDGKVEKWESFASGQAIYKKYQKPMGEITDDESLESIAKNIAVGLIDLIATLTPDIIVLGGGAGRYHDRYSKPLREALEAYQDPMFSIPAVVTAQRPDEAVIYGCFELARRARERVY